MEFAKGSSKSSTVLVIGPDNEAHADLRGILGVARYGILNGRTVRQSAALLASASVVICEACLPDGTWRDVLAILEQAPSRLPLIVTSPIAGPRLWAEVLNLGGYDVLAQPFSTTEVVWSVRGACSTGMDHECAPGQLPENGQQCALLGNGRPRDSRKPLYFAGGAAK